MIGCDRLTNDPSRRGSLWFHLDVARRAMKVGTIQGANNLEAIWNAVHGRHVSAALRQASNTSRAALGAP